MRALELSTQASYGSAWKGYITFCELFDYDPLMRGASHDDRVMLWRRYISSEIGVRQRAPQSVENVYIPGILSALTFHNADEPMRLAYDSRSVRDTLKGFKKLHAEKSPEGAQIKVPWSANLANESKRILVSKAGSGPGGAVTGPR